MPTVLHITESITASAGGTSTAFVGLVEALLTHRATRPENDPDAWSVRALAGPLPDADQARQWIANHAAGTWTFTGPPGRFGPGALAHAASELIARRSVHAVHLHGLWLSDLVTVASAASAANIPVVWQPHGMLVKAALRHSRLKKAIFTRLSGLGAALRAADAAIFTSDNERDTSDLARLGPRTRREVLPLPVAIPARDEDLPALVRAGRARWLADQQASPDRTLMDGTAPLDMNTPLLAFMGRLHPVKRVDLTLRAFAHARRALPDARLLLIGGGNDRDVQPLRELARSLGVADAIRWAGWLHGSDKLAAIAAADALILNSEFENFGYAIAEALALGTPVVLSDNLSLAPAVAEIGAGLSAPPEPAALGDAAARLLARPDRRDMGRRGRHWVEAQFSHLAVGARLAALYTALAEARR